MSHRVPRKLLQASDDGLLSPPQMGWHGKLSLASPSGPPAPYASGNFATLRAFPRHRYILQDVVISLVGDRSSRRSGISVGIVRPGTIAARAAYWSARADRPQAADGKRRAPDESVLGEGKSVQRRGFQIMTPRRKKPPPKRRGALSGLSVRNADIRALTADADRPHVAWRMKRLQLSRRRRGLVCKASSIISWRRNDQSQKGTLSSLNRRSFQLETSPVNAVTRRQPWSTRSAFSTPPNGPGLMGRSAVLDWALQNRRILLTLTSYCGCVRLIRRDFDVGAFEDS
jgi:hypothetical protein